MKTRLLRRGLVLLAACWLVYGLGGHFVLAQMKSKSGQEDKFRQLEEILPTPNLFRTGSGAPGPDYWQQQVDYEINVQLNDEDQSIAGSEIITYRNNSRDPLNYLWFQLDGNIHRPDSDAHLTATSEPFDRLEFRQLNSILAREVFDGGFNITACRDVEANRDLPHTVVKTMMRVDLPRPLGPGESFKLAIDWNYKINQSKVIRGRSGCEFFEEDGNYIYEMAQWFPRLCAYTDVNGWQHKQFLGRGEFTLEMGDYVVRITAPNDHIVASTGTLLNPEQVLTESQRQRLVDAQNGRKARVRGYSGRSPRKPNQQTRRYEDLDFQSRPRSRFCLGLQPQIHLGRHAA